MEGATLQSRNAFVCQLLAAVDETRLLSTIFFGLTGNFFVVGLVRLTQVGGVGVRHSAFLTHPQQGRAGVQAAGEGNAYFLASGNMLKNGCHEESFKIKRCRCVS